jgi:hypothetical protein
MNNTLVVTYHKQLIFDGELLPSSTSVGSGSPKV